MSNDAKKPICGIVMPISAIDGCAESHWADVLDILTEAVEDAGFEANIVSNADDVGIIHKRIIQNLYDNPIVVCDVSGKNPNVMFELGMRLAFDKPTIITKDDKTTYTFDTSAIEHIEYPRDLRFSRIVEFKDKLAAKIKATHEKATADVNYTTFLKHFGEFVVAKLDKKEVTGQEFILEELRNLRQSLRRIERSEYTSESRERGGQRRGRIEKDFDVDFEMCLNDRTTEELEQVLVIASSLPGLTGVRLEARGDHSHLVASKVPGGMSSSRLEKMIEGKMGRFDLSRKAAAES